MNVIYAILMVFSAILFGKIAKTLFQRYAEYKNKNEVEEARIDTQNKNVQFNKESDKLKDIEDR